MTKKQGIKAICFLIVVIAVLWQLDAVIRVAPDPYKTHMKNRFHDLYTDEKDTWDGVLLGTSYTDRAWAAPCGWETSGIAVYAMSTDSQPFALASDLLAEIQKYQDISFAVLELHGLTSEAIWTDAVKVRRLTDNIKRSKTWKNMIENGIAYMQTWHPDAFGADSVSITKLSLYAPIVQFHSRLTQDGLTKADFEKTTSLMKGVYEGPGYIKTAKTKLQPHTTTTELPPEAKEVLDKVIDYAQEQGITLVLLNLATEQSKEQYQEELNAAAEYGKSRGALVLNLNEEEALKDSGVTGKYYYDAGHMNAYGSHEFSEYLAKWLAEQLDLPDHRGDEAYKSWDAAAAVYDDWYTETLQKMKK